MFLLTVGHNCQNFLVQDVFQHSGEKVSRHFYTVLRVLAGFAMEMIWPPSCDETPPKILNNMKYYPSVGTIDGTYILAVVPTGKAIPYRSGQKNEYKVIVICSFDMRLPGYSLDGRVPLTIVVSLRRLRRDQAPTSLTHCKVCLPLYSTDIYRLDSCMSKLITRRFFIFR